MTKQITHAHDNDKDNSSGATLYLHEKELVVIK